MGQDIEGGESYLIIASISRSRFFGLGRGKLLAIFMERLDNYFSAKCGADFARRLPALRKKLGVVDISHRKPGYGVSGNTFRAFQGWENRPSDLYNGWAERITEALDPRKIAMQLESCEGFLEWHMLLLASLERRWRYYEGGIPELAHRLKLVDLFIKWLSAHDFGESRLTAALERNAHCALDSQTLRKMNESYSNALPLGNPSMGNVSNMRAYLLCQDLIERFSTHFGGTRLLFDYYSWKKGGGF